MQGLSLSDVADLTADRPGHLSKAMLSAIERGHHMPGLRSFVTISRALHIDPAELCELVDTSMMPASDLPEVPLESLRERAREQFWKGNYRRALAIYDAMLRQFAAVPETDRCEKAHEQARIEILRATALRRMGALNAARAVAIRASTLAEGKQATQAEAYVVLASILAQMGELPLARDLSERAVKLAEHADRAVQAVAWHERGAMLFRCRDFAAALEAFGTALRLARGTRNENHRVHIEGNIGSCLLELGKKKLARKRFSNALGLAREYSASAQEASWLIQLGRLDLDEGHEQHAEDRGRKALAIARRRDDPLTIFRATWLLHLIAVKRRPLSRDTARVTRLGKLFPKVRDYLTVDEIAEFKQAGHATGPSQGER